MDQSSSVHELLATIRDLAHQVAERPDSDAGTPILRRAALVAITELADVWLRDQAAGPPNPTEPTSV